MKPMQSSSIHHPPNIDDIPTRKRAEKKGTKFQSRINSLTSHMPFLRWAFNMVRGLDDRYIQILPPMRSASETTIQINPLREFKPKRKKKKFKLKAPTLNSLLTLARPTLVESLSAPYAFLHVPIPRRNPNPNPNFRPPGAKQRRRMMTRRRGRDRKARAF